MAERRLIQGVTIEADSVVIKGADFDALCALAGENEALRGNLSLAEEGLANYEEENQRLKAVLRDITSAYERRTELFTNDADCAANLYDRARGAVPQSGVKDG